MKRSTLKFVSFIFISVGTFLAISAVLPIAKYELLANSDVSQGEFLSPINSAASRPPQDDEQLLRPANWFTGQPKLPKIEYQVKYYKISVPRLKIKDAVVGIGGEDLSKSLIHYSGTAIPGQPGNAIIFGHSTLPQLFSSTNYKTIFSYLPSLKRGDDIFVDYDGIHYTFRVSEMIEVKPEDIQILEQKYDNSYLSLVTCVPPGTTLRRLVVRARLVPFKG
ncbi:MAG: sortase [Candidatus Blackburnbacteria bacterium]|nr:sortase [Candidatus Blackburnbacteria bacterium]